MDSCYEILVVDDSDLDCECIVRHLRGEGMNFQYRWVSSISEVNEALEERDWDVVLSDHNLPIGNSVEVIKLARTVRRRKIPVILVSGMIRTELAVELMRHGAADFIHKDDLSRLGPAIDREIADAATRQAKREVDAELAKSNRDLRRALESLARMQDQIVAAERFRALGQMASGIAHDFNNSLMILQGTTDLLRIEHPEAAPLISQMAVQISDAASVVKRLKAFYSENPVREESPVQIDDILRDVREFTKPRWRSAANLANAPIHFVPSEATNTCVWANPSQLREILTNLIINSCDAMEETGGEIQCRVKTRDKWTSISIVDTGPGMTDEVRARCFDPLYSTKGSKGTGLGLSIVDAMVQAFGGTVTLESELGVGTAVTIELRTCEACDANKEVAKEPELEIGGADNYPPLSILVVDDEPQIAHLLRKQLESLGHQAESMTSPREVPDIIASSDFDLVIADRSMPQMSGDELARAVKRIRPDIGFIMASGYGDLMKASGEIPEGVDFLLAKPLTTDDLASALRSMRCGDCESEISTCL